MDPLQHNRGDMPRKTIFYMLIEKMVKTKYAPIIGKAKRYFCLDPSF
jgi:hypothetical protein